MVAPLILLSAVAISIVLNRVATRALVLTGLSEDAAVFQARSTVTGTGFTTEEAEEIVRHPVRRRIVMFLMLLQNAGLVTVISTLILSFVGDVSAQQALWRAVLLLGGLGGLLVLTRSSWIDRLLKRVIERTLARFTDLHVKDYYSLLDLQGGFTVSRIEVGNDTWLAGQRLDKLDLPSEGVLVLSIHRPDGSRVGAPRGRYTIHAGDTLVLYGRRDELAELKNRQSGRAGEAAHEREQARYEERMRIKDRDDAAQWDRARNGEKVGVHEGRLGKDTSQGEERPPQNE